MWLKSSLCIGHGTHSSSRILMPRLKEATLARSIPRLDALSHALPKENTPEILLENSCSRGIPKSDLIGTRVPLKTGAPPRISGSIVIRSFTFMY